MSIKEPFSADQVAALNAYQARAGSHPFTCANRGDGNHRDHPVGRNDRGTLVATTRGWICPFCDYVQDWAHEFMARPKP